MGLTPPDPARALFDRPTLDVADAILGWHLVRSDPDGTVRVGRIVEVEAYIGEDDRASHARFGRTGRNGVMYGPPGRAYVYLVYGMHDCLNVVTEADGAPAALLIRAVEPLAGVDAMRAARARRTRARTHVSAGPPRPVEIGRITAAHRLAAGPGLVCAAFDLDRSLTGADLLDLDALIHVEPPPAGEPPPVVASGPRVGVDYAGPPWKDLPWRRWIEGHPSVSRPTAAPPPAPPAIPSSAPPRPR